MNLRAELRLRFDFSRFYRFLAYPYKESNHPNLSFCPQQDLQPYTAG